MLFRLQSKGSNYVIRRPSRRDFLRSAAAATAGLAAGSPRAARAQNKTPNIVLIMADDMGYSDIGCYGGEIETPNLDRLAAGGMRFTQFYNNAKCAPTRASLLTGLYSQQVGSHDRPTKMTDCVTIAEVLKDAGYGTYMTGKWHAEELPVERGFDRYFGLADGCCNFFNPGLQRSGEAKPAERNFPRKWASGSKILQPFTPQDKDFYTTDAFTDEAINYLDDHESETNPFFLYVAYTAPHYPLQARPEDIAKYRGKYKIGWDEVRRRRYESMVNMGLIDERWGLAPRDARVAAWEDVEDRDAWDLDALHRNNGSGVPWEDARDRDLWDLKMAVYAAMVDRMDQNIGRIMDKVREMGEEDNTLVLFLSDNGGCAEMRNYTPGVPPGPAHSYRSVDPPWANVQNTPFRKFKRWDHEGGISTPLIAYWPNTIEPSQITSQVGHIIDVMATCAELGGATYPEQYESREILPLEGKSLVPIFQGKERDGHDTICWQFNKCRAVRKGKWKAVRITGQPWELYDLEADRTELHDLAKARPKRVQDMANDWLAWAGRCGALPES